MLIALGTLSSEKAHPVTATYDDVIWFLNYAATHPDAKLNFKKKVIWFCIYTAIAPIYHIQNIAAESEEFSISVIDQNILTNLLLTPTISMVHSMLLPTFSK